MFFKNEWRKLDKKIVFVRHILYTIEQELGACIKVYWRKFTIEENLQLTAPTPKIVSKIDQFLQETPPIYFWLLYTHIHYIQWGNWKLKKMSYWFRDIFNYNRNRYGSIETKASNYWVRKLKITFIYPHVPMHMPFANKDIHEAECFYF